ncbi:CDP-diacylglycerol--glycerol-3-phosphate 3-phosphatidyltransferase [Caldicellulosiruptor saccharolyticus DSM 8903]|uniref:CDP-diacylglycerol--glycerol-3-phosphate 3-phosphatidyltransferase n=1 Tax=Caldicellulosiruptor saccharolyticus (strain ATCC 43494 / DSM 8903 / Tp8T 6331) TaxID=351627 RepID=A4XL06_CALS8|nr:CDP-diacylglycerol--glycerol-3-phosphate 3-phosphatidyltransferase [Caldicellulosiruptor saccharolyticus]ABP67591.1 CDP-diacylglycerol--glycerol-3-phosphate 3-phosphatidyltransferase [Caldicellulosiruptor saccharolyticus DSM 8903]
MNLPNVLTILRFFLIPLFVLAFFSSLRYNYLIAIGVFLLSGLTDVLDGFIARRCNMVTEFGKLFDPLADKLMILTVLWCLAYKGYIPSIIFYIVLFKELFMIVGSVILYGKIKIVVSANIYGKIATVLFYIAIISLLLNMKISLYILVIAVVFAIFALIVYTVKYLSEYKKLKSTSNE